MTAFFACRTSLCASDGQQVLLLHQALGRVGELVHVGLLASGTGS